MCVQYSKFGNIYSHKPKPYRLSFRFCTIHFNYSCSLTSTSSFWPAVQLEYIIYLNKFNLNFFPYRPVSYAYHLWCETYFMPVSRVFCFLTSIYSSSSLCLLSFDSVFIQSWLFLGLPIYSEPILQSVWTFIVLIWTRLMFTLDVKFNITHKTHYFPYLFTVHVFSSECSHCPLPTINFSSENELALSALSLLQLAIGLLERRVTMFSMAVLYVCFLFCFVMF